MHPYFYIHQILYYYFINLLNNIEYSKKSEVLLISFNSTVIFLY